jgi:membrane protease YdiL (CAAX protease family)
MPLQPATPQHHDWLSWLFYQFFYIAVAEEVFFRGYVQANILRLTEPSCRSSSGLQQWLSICISAACFAAAHIIINGQLISALTFLPGLIAAWLFARTKGLLAPILFHGLANTCYCIFPAAFA